VLFFAAHVAVVPFVVIAGKMEYAVQHQDFKFLTYTVAILPRILGSERGRDGYIAGRALAQCR
jgi:hypothetical protein